MAGFRDRIKGKYAIDRKLGAGSFGEVFTCWNSDKSHVDELLVVKVIHIGAQLDDSSHSSVASKNASADAQREAKILKKLNHKNIIQFHDSFIFRDEFCIVTEFCDGGDLEDFMNQRKEVGQAIPYSLVVKWSKQLLEALDYMHSFKPKPIVHRDIKSRNVFLKSNQIKLGDMGKWFVN
jgi:serine/threonine protein kinase